MPNIKSQKKRVITNRKATLSNKAVKSELKTTLKKAGAALTAGSDNGETVAVAFSAIDTAARKGVLHKNTANRKKAAFAKAAAKAE